MADLPPHANLRICEVAEYLSVSNSTVYAMVSDGDLPATRVRGALRIPHAEFLAWLKRNTQGPAGSDSV